MPCSCAYLVQPARHWSVQQHPDRICPPFTRPSGPCTQICDAGHAFYSSLEHHGLLRQRMYQAAAMKYCSPTFGLRPGPLLLAIGMFALVGTAAAAAAAADGTDQWGHEMPGAGRKLLLTDVELQMKAAGKAAAEFCKGPEIKKQTCGWLPEDERRKTVKTCEGCGTFWGNIPDPPYVHDRCRICGGSAAMAPRYVSLACRPGKLLVRAVWKLLEMPTDGVTPGAIILYIGGKGSSKVDDDIRRCKLKLPAYRYNPGDPKVDKTDVTTNELDAALRSEEVNCSPLVNGHKRNPERVGFPNKDWYSKGAWYSDTFHFNYGGCDAVSKPGALYSPTQMAFVLNNVEIGPKLLLAKWEVQEAN